MPDTAINIVSVERMRQELRLGTDTSQDTRVQDAIESAVSEISESTGIPLVDYIPTTYISRPNDAGKEVCIANRFVTSIEEWKYWATTQEQRDLPTGAITSSELGNKIFRDHVAWIWPPAAGWPEILIGSRFQVKYKRGISEVPKGLRMAIIVLARHYFEGYRENLPTLTFNALINKFKVYYA